MAKSSQKYASEPGGRGGYAASCGADGDTLGAFVGQRSEIPAPRARTPDPIRKASASAQRAPAPYRNFDFKVGKVDVVYAEDESVFRETAVRQLVAAGFARSNIHESENGLGALEDLLKLQFEGNMTMPLLVLLDIRMPGMDGRECALQIQELVKKQTLRREPFVICISSCHSQVIVKEGKGNFQVVLPKPFNAAQVTECIQLMTSWWTTGEGRVLPAWKAFSKEEIDIIIADDEPIARMHCAIAFCQAGVRESQIIEFENQKELCDALGQDCAEASNRPLVVIVAKHQWAARIRELSEEERSPGQRLPFIICTTFAPDANGAFHNIHEVAQYFDAFLPYKFARREIEWCLELLRLWWLTRGEGPNDRDSESDPPSGDEEQ